MRVLMITGDKRFMPGHPRYELQRSAVERIEALYVGRSAWWPALPQGPFDVVTTQDPLWRGLFGWIAARRLGARFNAQVHMDLRSLTWGKHMLAQIVLRHADSVRVVSRMIKGQVEKCAPHARVKVLPVFVDLEPFKSIVRAPQGNAILWIGRFEEEKDPLCAIRVLKEVRAQGIDASLILLGAGTMDAKLKEAAHGFPVELPGWQDPLPYLSRASLVLSTSMHESWGASIVESLAAGVPVVAPDVGAAREAGAIVATRDKLAEAVAKALTSGARGELKIPMLTREQWIQQWLQTLQ